MNTKQNQRFLETERKLYEAYFKLLRTQPKEVSIAAICRESGINRTSFYLHFLDIPDLKEKTIRRYLIEDLKSVIEGESLTRIIESIFRYVKDHKEMYQLLWTEEDPVPVQKQLEQLFSRTTEAQDEQYRNSFFQAGLIKVLHDWLMQGCQEEEAVMAALVKEWIPQDF